MWYQVFIHKKIKKKFDRIRDQVLKNRLKDVFMLLSDPFALDTIKIIGEEDTFRTRIGKYRILFILQKNAVFIIDFDIRGNIYK